VAWFGTAMQRVEAQGYADTRRSGVAHAAVGVGLGLLAGGAVRQVFRGTPATAAAVAVASSGRMLRGTARTIERHLLAGDLPAARAALPSLVGRDPSGLDERGIAAAVVESLAENTVDAVVAPAFWALVAGPRGVLVHRAVNTMDAMVGHHSPRYEHYGWAAARLDDAMAWVPARITAALVALAATSLPGTQGPRHVLRVVRRDGPSHPSPNAGVAESAVAGALGVELGGPLRYGERVEERPRLGDGPRPDAQTIARARRLVDRVELLVVAASGAWWWLGRGRRRVR
jgi:adenosylcobinamide-phosphate synthase